MSVDALMKALQLKRDAMTRSIIIHGHHLMLHSGPILQGANTWKLHGLHFDHMSHTENVWDAPD